MADLLHTLLRLKLDVAAFLVVTLLGIWLIVRVLRRNAEHPALARVAVGTGLILAAAGVLLVEYQGRQENERLRAMLSGVAPSYAVALERLGYHRLPSDVTEDDPLYREIIELQKAWLETEGAADDIYTLHRLDDGTYVLMVDSETDYNGNGLYDEPREMRTPIGEAYDPGDDELPALECAFGGHQAFDGTPSNDRWGTWVTSFSPIRAPDGRVVAVLGVDYEARSWLTAILVRRVATLCLYSMLLMVPGIGVVWFQMLRDRQTQRLLRQQNTALASANRELEHARVSAMAAANAKTEFLANMSHELRTPLTAILGFADVLGDEAPLDEASRQHVGLIRSNGQYLLAIISDVLDLARLEAGFVATEAAPCDPLRLGDEVRSLLGRQAAGKGLDLRIEAVAPLPRTITTDPLRLRQILLNLMGNAVKFTEQGHVALQLEYDAARDTISFAVVDTGVGIPRDALDRLFVPFHQVDGSMTRRLGGSGLGLSLSRRLAQVLGGDITVVSEPGRGSTFTLTIPCGATTFGPADAAAEVTTATDEPLPQLRGRVLLAEDGPDNQRLIGHLLRKQGLDVEVVANGRLALDTLLDDDRAFDLVLMDMQMPVMDGYTAVRELRAAGFARPIVAVTAHAMPTDRERCLAAGCDGFVTKPVDRRQMFATLRELLD